MTNTLKKANAKIENTVVDGYHKIEDTVVGGYHKIEDTVVGGYHRLENAFVSRFLTQEGETVDEAKARISEPGRVKQKEVEQQFAHQQSKLLAIMDADKGISNAGIVTDMERSPRTAKMVQQEAEPSEKSNKDRE